MCSGDLTAFPDRLLYDQRIIEERDMSKADKDKVWYGNLERITGTKLVK